MSLLNAWVTPTEAIVAVDTDGAAADGARLPSSKLLPIPHLGAVLASCGQLAYLAFVYLRAITSGFATFDEMRDAMLAMLAAAEENIPAEFIAAGAAGSAFGNELLAVGWSDRARKHAQAIPPGLVLGVRGSYA
jgi:hypothetical protein